MDSAAEKRISLGLLSACRKWPYASTAILSMTAIESDRIQNMGVDSRWRLYYNPEFVHSTTEEELVFALAHEVCHLVLNHSKRASRVIRKAGSDSHLRWNKAADLAVNSMLRAEGFAVIQSALLPEKFGLDDGLSAEEYYAKLQEEDEKQQQQQSQSQQQGGGGSQSVGGGSPDEDGSPGDEDSQSSASGSPGGDSGDSGGDGESDPTDQPGGSGSDGVQRPWEASQDDEPLGGSDDAEGEGEAESGGSPVPSGISDDDAQRIIADVAKQAEKMCGGGSAGMQRVIEEQKPPRISPEQLLCRAVSRNLQSVSSSGDGISSYRRPSRRPGLGGALRPKSFKPSPRVAIVVDTSGSMSGPELATGLGLIARVLRTLRSSDGVRVISGDVGRCSEVKAFRPDQIQLVGGGGTNMGAIICEVEQSEPSDLIICITDGYTPWPKERLRTPVVACITQPNESVIGEVPKWIHAVGLE